MASGPMMDPVVEEDVALEELPLFANDEAKAIFAQILAQREALEKASTAHTEHEERVSVMEEHLKNVRRELEHTTELARAKAAEIQSEEHNKQLATREAGRYAQELRREQEELEAHDGRLHGLQNSVFDANDQMDKFKLEMNWNQDELEQWALAAKQKEEDDVALQRYAKADDVRINALTLQIDKLTAVELAKKIEVEQEKTETAARQIELERTAEEFRTLHSERQRLLRQWRDAVDTSSRRDRDIAEVAAQYGAERAARVNKTAELAAERAKLKQVHDLNADLEQRAAQVERSAAQRREDLARSKERCTRLADETDVLKAELASSARAVVRLRRENDRAALAVVQRRAALDAARQKYHAAKERFDLEVGAKAGAEHVAAEADLELKTAEGDALRRERALDAVKQTMFRQSQALFVLRKDEANHIAELSGAQSQRRNLEAKIRRLDSESTRQLELVYTAEFQIQQMERKVARGLGERSDDEKRALNEQIAVLEKSCGAQRDRRKMLAQQTRRLGNELRAAQRRRGLAADDVRIAAAKIQELDLQNKAAERSLKDKSQMNDEALVQNDVLRLELKRLRDALAERADVVYTLENRKQQLALSMAERKKEIALHDDVVAAQKRLAADERHKAQLELGDRKLHVKTLAAKFETLTKCSRLKDGDEEPTTTGQPAKSQAYYLIAAAQKREELQRIGDDLDLKIRQREREMRALDATLNHVNGRNAKYRESFKKPEPKSADADDLARLKDQERLANDALFRRKKALQRLATDYDEDTRRLDQVQTQCDRLRERNGHLREAKHQMDVELQAANDALDKLHVRLNRLSEMHRDSVRDSNKMHRDSSSLDDDDGPTVQERAFEAAALDHAAKSVVATISELAKAYPEIAENVDGLLADLRLHLPSP